MDMITVGMGTVMITTITGMDTVMMNMSTIPLIKRDKIINISMIMNTIMTMIINMIIMITSINTMKLSLLYRQ